MDSRRPEVSPAPPVRRRQFPEALTDRALVWLRGEVLLHRLIDARHVRRLLVRLDLAEAELRALRAGTTPASGGAASPAERT